MAARKSGYTKWEMEMGTRLQRLRKAAGLSQSQLARRSGIPLPTLRGWEQGRATPLLDAAARLAVALGCDLNELAGIAGPKKGGKR
jgi:transcriptional regulator with XRE-family HTH domain